MGVTESFPEPDRRAPGRAGYGLETNGFPRM